MATLLEEFQQEFAKVLTIDQDEEVTAEGMIITFPAYMQREDFDRMMAEIQAALQQAEFRGEQKAIAFLIGEGSGPVLGTVKQPELNELTESEVAKAVIMTKDEAIIESETVKSRFLELLEQYPELTRPQAYVQAVLELGDRVIAEAVKRIEDDDRQAALD